MFVIMGDVVVVVIAVGIFVLTMDVVVGLGMAVFVVMHDTAVAMDMRVDVLMFVVVLQMNGVLAHQNRGDDHNGKTNKKLDAHRFSWQEEAEGHAQEGGNGIVGAGFCGAQIFCAWI